MSAEAESSAAGAEATAPSEELATIQPKVVVYCGVCAMPPEYCEFGATVQKCEDWLKTNHADLHAALYSEEALESKIGTMTLEAHAKASADLAKKNRKEAARLEREAEKKASSIITIKRSERTKRKYITIVSGVEAFDLTVKGVAKELGKKFACGSSVTKATGGVVGEEITVQGDLSDEIMEFLVEVHGVDEDNIQLVEDKKGKKAGG